MKLPLFTGLTGLSLLLSCSTLFAENHLPKVEEAALRAHLALLASDLFEGRGTGQRGGDLTVAYLEAQVAALGLLPANGKSFRQPVQITGLRSLVAESSLKVLVGGQAMAWQYGKDWVWGSSVAQAQHSFAHDLVFVGHGVSAEDEAWDDFKGQDLRGKILLVLPNDPQPTAQEPERFGGKAMTYFGRRAYKHEEAVKRGARGVLTIHEPSLAGSSWSSIGERAASESFQLPNKRDGLPVIGWISEAAARALFAAVGQDYEIQRARAEQRDFKPLPLAANLQGELRSSVRQIEQFNVAALIPGSDPVLQKEVVIYSAHWDHLGKLEAKPGGSGQDLVYNGAIDNASGTAALLAMAKVAVAKPAKRSQMFLWVAAEEQGLLGSEHYVTHPLWPLAKTAANLNVDVMNFAGLTRDIGSFGAERSELGERAAQVAKSMQLKLAPPRVDVGGVFFRSDHFNFAKAGIPAFSVAGGTEYLDQHEARAIARAGFSKRYHQLNDEYDPAWDLSGMVLQAQFALNLGRAVADAPTMPQWKAGDPFGKLRKTIGQASN